MKTDEIISALAEYIDVLEKSALRTHRVEDRSRYQQHLAAAALMFAAMEKHRSIEKLKELVASERRSYGGDYLDGLEGEAAESAFHALAKLVQRAT
ncbi:MAG: hypothetical protein JSW07_05095 [bacterium]|nr:MAG: hypothetical protein JSW07_05095 [bacterium]